MKLNLGCCNSHLHGYVNVDICEPADQLADLTQRWPWDDNSVDEVIASDIVEHLPSIIHTLSELYRVLKPGGLAFITVPSTDGRGAWQDPTHVSYWNENSFLYVKRGDPHNTRFRKHYGMDYDFELVSLISQNYTDQVVKVHAVLKK